MAEAGDKGAKTAAAPAEGGEGEAPPKGGRLKTILILVILILVLAGGGLAAGVMFLGLRLPFMASAPPTDAEAAVPAPAPAPEKAPPPKPAAKPIFVAVPPIVVNLADAAGRRFIRMSVSVEVSSPEGEAAVKENAPKIIDAFQLYLRSQSLDSFNSVASLMQVRRDLLARLNRIDPRIQAKAVLFQDLIIQ
jgi:flagellar FliL protein